MHSAGGTAGHRPPALGGVLLLAAEEAGAALETGKGDGAVHGLRKAFKRMRALLRLVRGARAGEAGRLRDALAEGARALSASRDQAAQREALDELVTKAGLAPEWRDAALAALAEPDDESAAAPGLDAQRAPLDALVEACRAAGELLGGVVLDKALLAAIIADYARARRRGRDIDAGDAEELHELRKAVIAHRFHMELLTPLWPVMGRAREGELHRLREKLGKHHDLAVLLVRLAELPRAVADSDWHAPVAAAARARQERLARSALRLHARLFAEKPEEFRRRYAAYMKAMSDGE
ncbi:CHAD domain-containing protein [Ancylobacter sp. G4_0304]|uniref:CHAD domain-containing protein n=1 Tax=Ancylobacter sp. G4_0304 TaxID=3114289 RepID=UPI0039C636DE